MKVKRQSSNASRKLKQKLERRENKKQENFVFDKEGNKIGKRDSNGNVVALKKRGRPKKIAN